MGCCIFPIDQRVNIRDTIIFFKANINFKIVCSKQSFQDAHRAGTVIQRSGMWAGGDGGGLQWVLRAPDVQPVAAVEAGHFIRKSYF